MSQEGGTSRRQFLKAALTATGALAFGVWMPSCAGPGHRRKMADLAEQTGAFEPNVWLRIEPDSSIVFQLSVVEMGQGVMTSHAMMIAEELEVRAEDVRVEFAKADPQYGNPAMGGIQATGGSTSVPGFWKVLPAAAASAREMLRQAAATLFDVPASECVVADKKVSHPKTKRSKSYGELARTAALLPIPEVAPKKPADYKILGTSVARLDARPKVDGTAIFGIDVQVEGMVHGLIIRPPTMEGRVQSLDAAAAKAEPGVIDVFSLDMGVAVVAQKYWQAKRAASLVSVTWSSDERKVWDTDKIREGMRASFQKQGKELTGKGDVEEVFGASSAKVLEVEYDLPFLAHAPMEPQNCTAFVDGDHCEVWAPTQGQSVAVEVLSLALNIPRQNITINTTYLGGGFGRRGVQDFVIESALMSKHVGKPVKLIWTREDDTRGGYYRPQSLHRVRGVLDDSGKPIAWHHQLSSPSIFAQMDYMSSALPGWMPPSLRSSITQSALGLFRSGAVADFTAGEGASRHPYKIPNVKVDYHQYDTGVTVSFWRSVGHSFNGFVVESFIDELAHKAGQDPYIYRKNLLQGHTRHLGVLNKVAQAVNWEAGAPRGRFRGIAVHESFKSYCAQVLELSITEGRLKIHKVTCAIDCGQVLNPDIVRAQMEGGIIFALSMALRQEITIKEGRVQQSNFHDYPMLRMYESPEIEVHLISSDASPTGVGEVGVPPLAPALTNALFAATNKRYRKLPLEAALRADGISL